LDVRGHVVFHRLAAFFFFIYGRRKAARNWRRRQRFEFGGSYVEHCKNGGSSLSKLHQWPVVKSASGEMFPVYDPSTEEVIAHVASGTAADVDRAVKPRVPRLIPARAADQRANAAAFSTAGGENSIQRRATRRVGVPQFGQAIVEAEYDIADAPLVSNTMPASRTKF